MADHPLADLPPRGKEPNSKRTLDAWIEQAANRVGIVNSRLSWLVAASVAIAALQRAHDPHGEPRLLLKGGAWLELRLGLQARATADVDLLYRGDLDTLIGTLDDALAAPWGALELQRGPVEEIVGARRLAKPHRFDLQLQVRGVTWRRIQIEVAADEAQTGARAEAAPAPSLDHLGLPSPVELAGIVMDYQVAQKLHACSDPHDPPEQINDRVRDVADLLVIRDAFYANRTDLRELQSACQDLFAARAEEVRELGESPRAWPPTISAHEHWRADWPKLADELGLPDQLETATSALNRWIEQIDRG